MEKEYYTIAEKGTKDYLFDEYWNTIKFENKQDAIDYLTDYLTVENLDDYDIIKNKEEK